MKRFFLFAFAVSVAGAAGANHGAGMPGAGALSRATINSFDSAVSEAYNACNNGEMRSELDKAIKSAGTAKGASTVATVGAVAGTGADVSRRLSDKARDGKVGTATQIVSVAGHATGAVGAAVAVGSAWGIPGAVDKIKARFNECLGAVSTLETFSPKSEAGQGVSMLELDRFNARVNTAREAASMFNQINVKQLDTAKSMAMTTVGVAGVGAAASGTAGVMSGLQGYRHGRDSKKTADVSADSASEIVSSSESEE